MSDNGTARFEKCKQLLVYHNCLLTSRHLVVKVLIYILMSFTFSTPALIRQLWQLETTVLLHWRLTRAVLLVKRHFTGRQSVSRHFTFRHFCVRERVDSEKLRSRIWPKTFFRWSGTSKKKTQNPLRTDTIRIRSWASSASARPAGRSGGGRNRRHRDRGRWAERLQGLKINHVKWDSEKDRQRGRETHTHTHRMRERDMEWDSEKDRERERH